MTIIFSIFYLISGLFYTEGFSVEYCKEYYNSLGQLISSQVCPSYCCGTCQSRKCCTDWTKRLNQAKCDNDETNADNNEDYFDHVVLAFIITASAVVLLCLIGCILRLIQQAKTQRRLRRLNRRNMRARQDERNIYSISNNNNINGAPPPYSKAFEKSYNEQLPPKYDEIQMKNLNNDNDNRNNENDPKY